MTELEAILLLLLTLGNIVLFIILGLGYMSNKKHKEQVTEYEKLVTSYKKTLSIMDANISHLRQLLKEKSGLPETTENDSTETTENVENEATEATDADMVFKDKKDKEA